MTNHAAGEPAEREAFEAGIRFALEAVTGHAIALRSSSADHVWNEALVRLTNQIASLNPMMMSAAWQARAALNAPAAVELTSEAGVCAEILSIMEEYDRQEKEHGCVDTPGGLEHMGDVWRLFESWRDRLTTKEPK
jgi:hypothetical protein